MYSTNIGTEYINMVYTLLFSFQNAVCFIILTYLVPILFTFYIQGVLKLKENNYGAKRLKDGNPSHSEWSDKLTSKRCILYIYSTNIGTEYINMVYTLLFSLQNAVCFIILTYLVPILFKFYIQGVLKLKK